MADDPQVTTREEWLIARRELLAQEKELTRHRDRVNAARRALPMVEITENYAFDGPHGTTEFADLFDGRSQLLIYHFMFEPDADEGCPSCSFTMDNVGHLRHLYARDTSFAAVSRAPLNKLEQYRQRMGWTFPWYSSHGSDFNYDFHVTLDAVGRTGRIQLQGRGRTRAVGPRVERLVAAKSTASALSSARVSASSTPTPATRAAPRSSSAPTTGSTSLPAAARRLGTATSPRRRPLHELATPPRRIRAPMTAQASTSVSRRASRSASSNRSITVSISASLITYGGEMISLSWPKPVGSAAG